MNVGSLSFHNVLSVKVERSIGYSDPSLDGGYIKVMIHGRHADFEIVLHHEQSMRSLEIDHGEDANPLIIPINDDPESTD